MQFEVTFGDPEAVAGESAAGSAAGSACICTSCSEPHSAASTPTRAAAHLEPSASEHHPLKQLLPRKRTRATVQTAWWKPRGLPESATESTAAGRAASAIAGCSRHKSCAGVAAGPGSGRTAIAASTLG